MFWRRIIVSIAYWRDRTAPRPKGQRRSGVHCNVAYSYLNAFSQSVPAGQPVTEPRAKQAVFMFRYAPKHPAHSYLKATIGSTLVARRAGINPASIATNANNTATETK